MRILYAAICQTQSQHLKLDPARAKHSLKNVSSADTKACLSLSPIHYQLTTNHIKSVGKSDSNSGFASRYQNDWWVWWTNWLTCVWGCLIIYLMCFIWFLVGHFEIFESILNANRICSYILISLMRVCGSHFTFESSSFKFGFIDFYFYGDAVHRCAWNKFPYDGY